MFFWLWAISWIVGGLTLAAGVVGVSNITLITVKERTKEFGVRKALGATPSSVVLMVLMETIVLQALGVLVVTAAAAGLIPAFHAASIKPIEALRTE